MNEILYIQVNNKHTHSKNHTFELQGRKSYDFRLYKKIYWSLTAFLNKILAFEKAIFDRKQELNINTILDRDCVF